jgi:LysR family hydrogen peroxide-inducible transcriptional activator
LDYHDLENRTDSRAMNLPSTRQLRYFAALAEHRHFGRAARACHVSQSAFSTAIRELETQLGVQLVDRTNRRVTITALGRDVATQARLCLRDLEALVELARTEREPLAGPLRLGVIPTIAPFLLPRVLPAIRRRYPKLRIYLREGQTADVVERLNRGDLDVVLLALPYDLPNAEVLPLFQDGFRLACRNGTALVDPEHYRFSRLDSDVVLLLEDGHCLRDHAIAACRLRNLEKVRSFAASSLLTLIEMVDADLGITFLPAMAEGSSLLKGTRVRLWPVADTGHREIALAWRRGSARATEFRALGDILAADAKVA